MNSPRHHRRLAAAIVAVAAALCSARPARADVSSFELSVVTLVNQERAALGRAPLGTDIRLFNAAEGHTDWMCANQTLSHIGAGGSTPGTRATAAGYPWFAVGETIGQGFPSPQDIVNGWRGSSPHWTILMSATYRDIGVAYAPCAGALRRHYWTAMVANSRSAATPAGPAGPTAPPTRTPTRPPPPGATTAPPAGPTATIVVVTATPPPAVTRTPTPRTPPTATSITRPTSTPPPAPTAAPPSGAGATLRGRVILQGRTVHAGTIIYVNGVGMVITAGDGTFTVYGVAPGFQTVRAQHYGFLGAAAQVSLASGQTVALGPTQLLSGDVHLDQRVTSIDQLVVQLHYGACVGTPAYAEYVDLDGSGCIDTADLGLVTPNIGRYGPTAWR
ncbi:MAG: CAP domain-containing protein [Anaerolineae bacterium]